MKLAFLTLPIAFLVACQVPISSLNAPKPVGTVEVLIDLDKDTATATWQPHGLRSQAVQTTTTIQLVSNSLPLGFVSNPATNTDFISAKFNVSNLTANALTDLTLVAFHKSGNQSNTAIRNIVNFVGASLDNEVFARGIKPANMVTSSLTLDAGNEDLQLFTEAEVSQLQTQASAVGEINTNDNEYLFPYGYVSRATGSNTSRTLGAGTNTGTLNIAIRIPNNNAAPNNSVRRFNMTFVAFDQPVATRVSESLEEQGANSGAVTRANASNFNASRVAALQNSALHVAKDGTKVNVCQVRTAGTATNPLARLETGTLASGSGTLDTCFAALGKRVLSKADLGGGSFSKKLLAQQADGKYVVGGNQSNGTNLDFVVVRYNKDGSLDSTFGTNGQVTTDFAGGDDRAFALALDNNQKIVMVGTTLNQFNQFAIARYNTDGSLDITFDSDGKVTTSFGANTYSGAYAVAFDSTNKIIAVGESSFKFAIAKYSVNGALDTSFDADGLLSFGPNSAINELYAVAVDSSDKIIVGGASRASNLPGFYIYKVNSDGTFDVTFNGTGSVNTDFSGTGLLTDLKIDSNGKIVAIGGGGSNIVMARYDSSGVLDNQFGTAGIVTINLTGREDVPSALTLDANGKLIIVGVSRTGTTNGDFGYLVARFLENGGLDTTFGNSGKLVMELETGLPKGLTSVIIDSSGQIVAAGLFVNLEFPFISIADIVWGLSLFRINP